MQGIPLFSFTELIQMTGPKLFIIYHVFHTAKSEYSIHSQTGLSASGGGGRNPPLLRSLAPPTFFSDPKNKRAKTLQSDLNFGVSMTTAPFIYRRYHFLKSPQLRCNINVFCIISRDCLFCFDGGPSQTFTNSCNGVPVLNEFLCILASLECAGIVQNNYSMADYSAFFHYIDLKCAENGLKFVKKKQKKQITYNIKSRSTASAQLPAYAD